MPESPDDFCAYLQSQLEQGVTELRLSLVPMNSPNSFNFVIHPLNQDGDTADFTVAASPPSLIRRISWPAAGVPA